MYRTMIALAAVCALGLRATDAPSAVDTDGDGVPDAIDVCCNTPSEVLVDLDGRPYGDADRDCDFDLDDWTILAKSFTGPLEPCPENECAAGTDNCDENATCIDTVESFDCTCNAGYEGDGVVCADIDGCSPPPCFESVLCVDIPAPDEGFTCGACPDGMTGNGQTCQCAFGRASCDGSFGNGCEVDHAEPANACGTALNLGSTCGDESNGFGCPETDWAFFGSSVGRATQWFLSRATECSSCDANVSQRIRLSVPAGTDYDLRVYSSCGALWASSTNGSGQAEEVIVSVPDDPAEDDSFNFWVEVRFFSGASCANWTLSIDGRN